MKTKLLVMVALLVAAAVGADQTNVTLEVTWTDFQMSPQAAKQATLTPLSPGGTYAGALLAPIPRTKPSDGSGKVAYTNVVTGYNYRLELETVFGKMSRTCGIPTTVSGTINAADYVGALTNTTFVFSLPNNQDFTNTVLDLAQREAGTVVEHPIGPDGSLEALTVDFSTRYLTVDSAAATLTITTTDPATTNRAFTATVFVHSYGPTEISLTFEDSWEWVSAKPTYLLRHTTGALSLTTFNGRTIAFWQTQ